MLPTQDPPPGWPRVHRSPLRVLSAAGFVVLTLVMAAVTVSAIITGDTAVAVVFGFGTVLLAHLTGMSIDIMRRPRPADHPTLIEANDRGEKGLSFRYAFWPYYWLTAVFALFTLGATVFAVVVARSGTAAGWVLAAVSAAGAVLIGWYLLVVLRLAPGKIVLTPTGIYHRSLFLEHFVPWDSIVDVQARDAPSPWITVKAVPASGTRELRHTGRIGGFEGQLLPFMVVRTQWLGANALPAYQAIKHYFQHPADRAGLSESQLRARH